MTESELLHAYRNTTRDPGRLPDAKIDRGSGGFTRREGTSSYSTPWDGTVPHSRVPRPAPDVHGTLGVHLPFEVIE